MTSMLHGPRAGSFLRASRALPVCALLALTGCGLFGERKGDIEPISFPKPATSITYEVEMEGSPSDRATDMLEQTLMVYRRQSDGAPSVAMLKRRAEQDVEAAKGVLRSYGYYAAEVEVEVTAQPADETPAPEDPRDKQLAVDRSGRSGLAAEPVSASSFFGGIFGGSSQEDEAADAAEAQPAPAPEAAPAPPRDVRAIVKIDPGPAFRLESHTLLLVDVPPGPAPEPLTPEAAQSPIGKRADAGKILDAEGRIVNHMRINGRPWAQVLGRRAVADMETATLTVETRLSPGPFAEYGDIVIKGDEGVKPDYIMSYHDWKKGQPVDQRKLRDYQSSLMGTSLFNAVTVNVPEQAPDAAGPVPVLVALEEGPRRTVAAGARYNSDTGPAVNASFIHRNLWGRGESLGIEGVLGQSQQTLGITFVKPQFNRDGQVLTVALTGGHEETEAYDQTGAILAAGLQRTLDRYWTAGLGGSLEYAKINGGVQDEDVFLVGVPGFVRYDGADDLLNPTEGVRWNFNGAPYYAFRDRGDAPFLRMETGLAGYLPLDGESKKYILAARTRVGSILADHLSDVPLNKRFYAGGGGSVRGYQQDIIGPLDGRNDPTGGRSVIEGSVELRARVYGDFGVVAFTDAGAVSTDVVPDFSARLQYSAGLGARYYSPVGPIRLDVAVPINPKPVDDPFGVYISIGQAF